MAFNPGLHYKDKQQIPVGNKIDCEQTQYPAPTRARQIRRPIEQLVVEDIAHFQLPSFCCQMSLKMMRFISGVDINGKLVI